MTGQILRKSYGTERKVKDEYQTLIDSIVNSLEYLGFEDIHTSFAKISPEEKDWSADYLAYYYKMLSNNGFKEETKWYYLITKTIAMLSLWHGLIDAGGPSPPPQINPPAIEFKTITKNKTNQSKGVVIIPTVLNYNEHKLTKLQKNIIDPVVKSKLILKLKFIGRFDDEVHTFFKDINEKVELIELKDDRGPSMARNYGIEESLSEEADVTLFMDDDVILKDALNIEKLIKLADSYHGLVAPLVASINRKWFDIYHDYDGTLNGVYFSNVQSGPRMLFATTCCLAVSNYVLKDGLRFDENFKLAAGEDIDFSIGALKAGIPIIPADEIVINHDFGYSSTDKDLDNFIRRYSRYGKGNASLLEKHPYYYRLLSNSKERHTNTDLDNYDFIPRDLDHIRKEAGK